MSVKELIGQLDQPNLEQRLRVQHWLADDPSDEDGEYQQVTCTACIGLHFIHQRTGKLIAQQDG